MKLKNIGLNLSRVRYIFDIGNGLETDLKRRRIGPAFRLPAPSLRGRAGGEAVCLFCFLMQNYLYALRTAIVFSLFCVLIVFNFLLFLDISVSYHHFLEE